MATNEKKTKNNSKKRNDKASSANLFWGGDLASMLAWRERGITEKEADMFAQKLLEWSRLEDSIDFLGFYEKAGLPRFTFDRWRESHRDLQDTYLFVKDTLGARRQRLAAFKKYETNPQVLVGGPIRRYHPDYEDTYNEDVANKKDIAEKESKEKVIVTLNRDIEKHD